MREASLLFGFRVVTYNYVIISNQATFMTLVRSLLWFPVTIVTHGAGGERETLNEAVSTDKLQTKSRLELLFHIQFTLYSL